MDNKDTVSPELGNGYTRIANEIMDALARTRIPGEARQVLDFIIRKTYGYRKKEDRISLSQFVVGTGLKKPTICKLLRKLESMNLIITQKDNGITQYGNELCTKYRFNKYFTTWVVLPKKVITVTILGNNHYHIGDTQKKLQKKRTKEKTIPIPAGDGGISEESSFKRFYDAYPRKVSRGDAVKAWHKVWNEHGDSLTDKIVTAITSQVETGHLDLRENKKFCPYPASWLNSCQWDDEITAEEGSSYRDFADLGS